MIAMDQKMFSVVAGLSSPWWRCSTWCGLASHDRGLVGTDVGELDRPRHRWWPRFFRVETCRRGCTLKRVWPPQLGASSSLLKNPRQNESSLIQFFYHESVEARMRGAFTDQGQLFSYISPEARVRTDHPLRKIRKLVRDVLGELSLSLSRL